MDFETNWKFQSDLPIEGHVDAEWDAVERVERFLRWIELGRCQAWRQAKDKFAQESANVDNCWNWFGFVDPNGYGLQIRSGRFRKIHRLAFRFFKGRIPKGMVVMHTCDNRKCFNPKHLFLGTQAENVKDMMDKGRHYSQKTRVMNVVAKLSRKPKE